MNHSGDMPDWFALIASLGVLLLLGGTITFLLGWTLYDKFTRKNK